MNWVRSCETVVVTVRSEEDSYQDTNVFCRVTAIATVVTVAEILKNNGLAIEKSKFFRRFAPVIVGIFMWILLKGVCDETDSTRRSGSCCLSCFDWKHVKC